MKRSLLMQMRNEWRDNVWLVGGLMIVSLAIWVLSVRLWNTVQYYFLPLGFDAEDVYTLNINTIGNDSPDYAEIPDESDGGYSQDLRALIKTLRQSPYVEAVALATNCTPYNMSLWGNSLLVEVEKNDTIGYPGNMRIVSPDMARVLRFESRTGKTPEALESMLRKGDVLISNFPPGAHFHFPTDCQEDKMITLPENILGKEASLGDDKKYRIGDVVNHIRRTDFDNVGWGGTIIIPINESEPLENIWNIVLRVKPGCGDKFKEEFENTPSMRMHRNIYLSQLTSLYDRRDSVQFDKVAETRLYMVVIILLISIIFLGLLGTFWFRVQQRIGEIAIRKICGATNGDIFRRIIGEGMILLVLASIIAAVAGWVIMKITDIADDLYLPDVLMMELATFGIVAIGIVISLAYPAYRAIGIEPAQAIKDE